MNHVDQNKDIITDIITELVSISVYQCTSILHGATTYVDTTRMVTQHTTYGDTTRMVRTRGGGRGQREAATLTLID